MPTCPQCRTNYSLTVAGQPCPNCGAPAPAASAQPWYQRWYGLVGIIVVGLTLLTGVAMVAQAVDPTHSTPDTAPGAQEWQTTGTLLAAAAQEHDDAVQAHNLSAALKAEQSIADRCQQAGYWKPGGDQEQRVRTFCSSVGHPVPQH